MSQKNSFSLRIISPGLVALLIVSIASLGAGLFVSFNTEFDRTVMFMFALFVFPAPYLFLFFTGLILYHSKRWTPIAVTFDIGALLLVLLWPINNLLLSDKSHGWVSALDESLFTNVYYSAALALGFIIILIIEGQIAWPEKRAAQ
ncbi:MAG: hypothetical protein OEX19_07155 [Gammaproteobacteria bacterium]|nr:hypothetical protein [Gammaproteobacteria bacterium]